jgi:hypothetical protein
MRAAWIALAIAVAAQGLALELWAPGRTLRQRALRALPVLALALAIAWAVWLASSAVVGAPWGARISAAWWVVAVPAFVLAGLGRPPLGTRSAVPLAVAQAAPGALLSFAPALAWSPWTLVLAGGLRALLPPAHAPGARAAEALSPGAFGLLLAGGLLLGVPVAASGVAGLDPFEATALAELIGVSAMISGLASASDEHLFRRLASWASVQAGLAVLIAALAPSSPSGVDRATALSHLGASTAALVAMIFVLGRVAAYVHVGDLAAYSGVLRAAVVRGQAVLAAVFLAVLASGQAPVAIVRLLLAAGGPARLACLFGLVGWIGSSLALLLAATRIARGRTGAPAGPTPEMHAPEIALTLALFAGVVAALVVPAWWSAPAAWNLVTRAAAR